MRVRRNPAFVAGLDEARAELHGDADAAGDGEPAGGTATTGAPEPPHDDGHEEHVDDQPPTTPKSTSCCSRTLWTDGVTEGRYRATVPCRCR